MKKYSLYIAAIVLVAALGAMTISAGKQVVQAQGTGTPLTGWAWSSNVGWISFNSADAGAGGGPYNVGIDSSGNLSGYAWSSTGPDVLGKPTGIGWISFNSSDLSVSPACAGTTGVNVNTTSGAVTGWARAVSGEGRNDGWDGCIELSGTNHPTGDITGNSGVTYDSTAGVFKGYAWGGTVVGWLTFSPNLTGGSCTGSGCVGCIGSCPITNPTTDLSLQVQDIGPGSPANTGSWFSAITYTIPSQGGSVTVPVKWVPSSATINIKTASTTSGSGIATDWGENSGLTSSPNSLPFSSQGTYNLVLTNPGPNSIPKVLSLSYILSGAGSQRKSVTITVNPYGANNNNQSCIKPDNTNPAECSGDTSSGPAYIVTPTTCSSGGAPKCSWTCLTGYVDKGGMCTKSSIKEI